MREFASDRNVFLNLDVQKPPSGGPRSPCICVANTARAGAASLARALGNAKKEEQKVAAKPKQMQ